MSIEWSGVVGVMGGCAGSSDKADNIVRIKVIPTPAVTLYPNIRRIV